MSFYFLCYLFGEVFLCFKICYGQEWFGMVFMVWESLVWCGTVLYGMIWFGLEWFGFGLEWFGMVYGLVKFGMV